ncbi:hypothetical protein ND864_17425 [Leptospira levettii]|uniref:hypothetical protein n=1 Tax=Leptospira levettii TaxID=2023178 RepID=UPI00223D4633|nr:hypothetical protein [Leptospira levettii]MCW7467504.1 hypothetical protein [Leptospira levettii]
MKRVFVLSLILTFSLSAKTLDNKAFCEVMAKGKEAGIGDTIKSRRLISEVEKELKSMIVVGTQVIPDENLRIIMRGGLTLSIECLNEKSTNLLKKEFGENAKGYYQQVGIFWVCVEGGLNQCPKFQLTDATLFEKLEEETLGKGDFSINGTFQIPKSKFDNLYFFDTAEGLKVTIKIIKILSVVKNETEY